MLTNLYDGGLIVRTNLRGQFSPQLPNLEIIFTVSELWRKLNIYITIFYNIASRPPDTQFF